MGRSVTLQPTVSYVPLAFGQRQAFVDGLDKEPVTLELRWLTAAEKREYEKAIVLRVGKDRQTIETPNTAKVAEKIVVENVVSVRNYEVNGKPITNGRELWDCEEKEITEEALKALQDTATLEAGRRDSLTSQSGG